ncbi:hypothetical protein C5167_030290 [Papaver somniferum]|nr:hypothetical protein C5167_030290 [Papaver somniferum]
MCEKKLSLLDEALNKVNTSDPLVISAVIDEFSEQPPLKERSAYHRLDIIDKCFSRKTIENVISALETESVKEGDAWISEAVHLMKKASPITLKIFLKSIRRGRLQGLDQCLAQEYRISCHGFHVAQDILEGYRANFLRKDRTPKWEPSRLELVTDEMVDLYFSKVDNDVWEDLVLPWEPSRLQLVTDEMVDLYFSKVDDDEWEDLVLPVRSNSSNFTVAKL